MQNTTLRQILLILLAGALGACGGGGSGGSDGGSAGGNPVLTNAAPAISGTPTDTIRVGEMYSFTPTASDPDGDTLKFSIVNAPLWASFAESTGEISGSPTASHIGSIDDVRISVSDGKLSSELNPFSIAVMPEILGRNNFMANGDVFPITGGYQSVGNLTLTAGDLVQDFANSDLTLTFDGDDKLVSLSGDTDVPTVVSPTTTVVGNVRSVVEVMTGAQINEDTDFGITLVEDTNYFVYYIGVAFDMLITDPNNPLIQDTITIETPYSGQSLLIADPTDTFLYRFSGTPLIGDFGTGRSDNGLIPFVPKLDYAPLDSFSGHMIENGSFGLGFKFVDLFEVSGTRVTKYPGRGADINWDDVFSTEVEYRSGINGDLNFAVSVLGFGLFSFDLAELSATVDVGVDRQQLAMSLRIAPDAALFPGAYSIGPSAEVTGSGYLNGDGKYGFSLDGVWSTVLPEASIGGRMTLENGVVGLAGTVGGDGESLTVSLTFANDETVGLVVFPESYAATINNSVSESLDRKIAEVEEMLANLEQATSDYEFEVSLRGLRSALPAIADAAIATLNRVPGNARSAAKSATLSFLASKCLSQYGIKVCLDDITKEDEIAKSAGTNAYDAAADAIVAPKAAMIELKKRVLESDDASLREALRQALDGVYQNQTVRVQVDVLKYFGTPFKKSYTIYSRDSTERVISVANAGKIKTARDNVYRIQATSDLVISTQQIFDQLPTNEVIASVKTEVEQGTANVPAVGGLGYRARGDSYEAFVTVGGAEMTTEINVLSPSEVRDGVGDLLAGLLLDAIAK